FESALRVPLILAGPNVPEGARYDCVVSTADIAPTILGLLGLDGGDRAMDLQPGQCKDRAAFASTVAGRRHDPPVHHALRRGSVKVIVREGEEDLFFDLSSDVEEQTPLSTPFSREAGAARRLLDLEIQRLGNPLVDVGGADRQLLEALGYLEP
ncbi:MAG: hypothetical protein HN348_07280, partial [Proteobacteria bacterium]|nr:hypothetical protein [Pseudomonadota bacterium]